MEPGEKPQLYKDIVLYVFGDAGLQPFFMLSNRSRSSFTKYVQSFGAGVGLVPREDFDSKILPTVSSPILTSGTYCAAPDDSDASPGTCSATTTPAALPCKVRQVSNPIRRAPPHDLEVFAGLKLSSLI